MRTHISFSELKIWNECPYKHKLVYKDNIKEFLGNEYTAFGTAIHYVCEKAVEDEKADLLSIFNTKFLEELTLLTEKKVEIKKDLVNQMRKQGKNMLSLILPALKETFIDFEVISAEENLLIPIENIDLLFKGFIDLILKTPDGKYHVIDWKTCSWGWNFWKRSEKMTTYQLTYYKHFFAKKYNIKLDNIETHFALLKRTAKKDKVEIFKVSSGEKKVKNALNFLNKALYNINNKNFVKNKISCRNCEFNKTKHCP